MGRKKKKTAKKKPRKGLWREKSKKEVEREKDKAIRDLAKRGSIKVITQQEAVAAAEACLPTSMGGG